MAKKKAPQKKVATVSERSPRIGTYPPGRLRALERELLERAREVGAIARSMERAKISELDVDGHSGVRHALKKINNFIGHATRSLKSKQGSAALWDDTP